MNLFQTPQKTSGYNTIPDASADASAAEDDTTAVSVPLGTTLLSPSSTTMTMGRRLSKGRRIAIVAGIMLLLMVVGGTVWMGDGGITTTTAEGLVMATHWIGDVDCRPARGTWTAGADSKYNSFGQSTPFETCWQNEKEADIFGLFPKYCWTRSQPVRKVYGQCIPDGYGWRVGKPYILYDPRKVHMCGRPCDKVHGVGPAP